LCPSGTPYMLYVRDQMPNLTTYMEQRGSQGNIAIHPYTATNYNREKVYRYLGFDQFLSLPDFQGASQVREFVSDQADFERIITEYQAAKASSDAPFYLFNVTMQNHSPYDKDYENLPETIRITSDYVEDKDQAERYLNLIHLSDEAAKKLVEYFKGVNDPTIIVMFGDHEPGLSDAFYESILPKKRSQMSNKEEMDLYHTPFFIWANYDIPEEEGVKISANYLQTKVKEIAGLDLTGYDKFLKQLHEQIPVICKSGYLDSKDGYHEVKDKTSSYWPQINEYWTLTYNHLFGRNGRASLFKLTK
jgi:phosphoglycerol transferase MdoB-like AlkP superfamily enzyme